MALSGYINNPTDGGNAYYANSRPKQGNVVASGDPFAYQPAFGTAGYPPQEAPKPKSKGLLGKVFGAVKSVVKGATVGVVKGIASIVTDPKKLLMVGGGIALSLLPPPVGPAIGAALLVYGAATAGKNIVTNASTIVGAYAAGNDAAAEAAWENIGTNSVGLAASAYGARGLIKSGQVPTSIARSGTQRFGKNKGQAKGDIVLPEGAGLARSLWHTGRYSGAQMGNGFRNLRNLQREGGTGAIRTAAQTQLTSGGARLKAFWDTSIRNKPAVATQSADDAAAAATVKMTADDIGSLKNMSLDRLSSVKLSDARVRLGEFKNSEAFKALSPADKASVTRQITKIDANINARITQLQKELKSKKLKEANRPLKQKALDDLEAAKLGNRPAAPTDPAGRFSNDPVVSQIQANRLAQANARTPEALQTKLSELQASRSAAQGRFQQQRLDFQIGFTERQLQAATRAQATSATGTTASKVNEATNRFSQVVNDIHGLSPAAFPGIAGYGASSYDALNPFKQAAVQA